MYEHLLLGKFVTTNILQQINNYITTQERLEHSMQFQRCLVEYNSKFQLQFVDDDIYSGYDFYVIDDHVADDYINRYGYKNAIHFVSVFNNNSGEKCNICGRCYKTRTINDANNKYIMKFSGKCDHKLYYRPL